MNPHMLLTDACWAFCSFQTWQHLRPNICLCSYVIDAVNNSKVGGPIIRALVNMSITFDSTTTFISDNVAYMKKAFWEVLKPVNAVHDTCWAHIMSLLGDERRKNFATVNRFVAKMKAILLFSSQCKNSYISFMKSCSIEKQKILPRPVLIRWNNWLLAVQ